MKRRAGTLQSVPRPVEGEEGNSACMCVCVWKGDGSGIDEPRLIDGPIGGIEML